VSERGRLVITDEDVARVATPAAPPPPAYPTAQPPLPSVQGVRPQPLHVGGRPAAGSSPFTGTVRQNVIASIVGVLVAWGVVELVFSGNPPVGHFVRYDAEFFALFGAVYAAVFASWESITSQVWEAAGRSALTGAVVGAIGGAISGAVAQELFANIVKSIERGSSVVSITDFKLDAARALGWAVLGVGVGMALGAAKRSSRRLVNGLIGGAIGGAIGGFAFNFVWKATESNTATRFVTDVIAGVAIGVAIGLVEVARRQAWLKVAGGGMTGKEFIVYHQVTNIGSSPKAEITLIKDPAIGAFHARIEEHGNARTLSAYEGMHVAVNGQPIASRRLRGGDVIQIGATSLAYHEKALPA
jgi:Inner membrane component of T3SS, cytoplasmic domain